MISQVLIDADGATSFYQEKYKQEKTKQGKPQFWVGLQNACRWIDKNQRTQQDGYLNKTGDARQLQQYGQTPQNAPITPGRVSQEIGSYS